MGRHLFLLGILLLFLIALALALAAITAIYTIRQGHPWWVTAGGATAPVAGMAALLRSVSKVLGPEGVTGIIKQRNNSPVIGLLDPTAEREQPPSSAS